MIVDSGRVKFERMRDLIKENHELKRMLDVSSRLCDQVAFKLQRTEFRERWAAENANALQFRISRAIESMEAVRMGLHGGNKQPKHGFNLLLGKCATCHGGGGRIMCEDECEDLGLTYYESTPRFHSVAQGREYWCGDCVGVGHTLSILDYLNIGE